MKTHCRSLLPLQGITTTALSVLLFVSPSKPAIGGDCLPAPQGLVGFWRAEADANDSAGTNDGVVIGGVTYATGMVGQGFLLNGTDGYIRIAPNASLNFENELTIELWFKNLRTDIYEHGFIAKRGSDGSPVNYGINATATGIGPYYDDPSETRPGGAEGGHFEFSRHLPLPSPLTWHHLAATYAQTPSNTVVLKTHIDGALVRTQELPGSLANTISAAPVTIGASTEYPNYEFFNGIIDEVSLYKRALSEDEIRGIYDAGSLGKCVSVSADCATTPSGLVGWWRGEGDGADQSAQNNGTLEGGVTFTEGAVGRGFKFDGMDDRVVIPDSPSWDLTNEITIELWYNMASDMTPGTWRGLVSKRADPIGCNFGLTIQVGSPGTLYSYFIDSLFFNSGSRHIYSALPSAPGFHHIAATYRQINPEQVEMKIFLDGQLAQTGILPGSLARSLNDVPVTIGSSNADGGEPFRGIIDEVSIYDRVLSPGEILSVFSAGSLGKCVSTNSQPCAALPSGLVGWWGGQSSALDESGGNNGSWTGQAAYGDGIVGQAFSFDGSGSYVEIPSNESLNLTNEVTLECWYKYTGTFSSAYALVAKRLPGFTTSCNYGVRFDPQFGGMTYLGDPSAPGYYVSIYETVPSSGVFHHLAATYKQVSPSQVEVKTYIDGSMVKNDVLPGNLAKSVNDAPLTIGTSSSTGDFFTGVIDEVSIYSRALSAVEVWAIYAAGRAGKCLNESPTCATPPSGLVGWWQGEGSAIDATGSNAVASISETTFAPGKVGQAFEFDGTSSAVTVPANSDLTLNSLTIEAWVFPLDGEMPRPIVEFGDPDGSNSPIHLWYNWTSLGAVPGALYGILRSSDGVHYLQVSSAGGLIPPNEWSYVALTYDSASSTACLYVNGTLVASNRSDVVIQPKTGVAINLGHRPVGSGDLWGGRRHLGKLDEVSLYGRALSAAELQFIFAGGSAGKCSSNVPSACVQAPSGMVGWWRGESAAFDETGKNDGNEVGLVTYEGGVAGRGFSFNGSVAYVEIPSSASLSLTNEITLELWYKYTGTSDATYGLIAKRGPFIASPCNYGVNVHPAFGVTTYFGELNASSYHATTYAPAPSAGVFHHLAITFKQVDPSHVELGTFIDGELVKKEVVWGNLAASVSDTPVTIGASNSTGEFFTGIIDEVSIYDRVLSPEEVAGIYRANNAGKCVSPAVPSISVQPVAQSIPVGGTVAFEVTAAGTPPLHYQWIHDGVALGGATNASLVIQNVQTNHAGAYGVRVSNESGSVLSSYALLTILPAPGCLTPSAGLVGWWRGENSTVDQVNNTPGTLLGNATYGPGLTGQGFVFDGEYDAVRVNQPANLDLQDLTIEAWIKRASTSIVTHYHNGVGTIFASGYGGYQFAINNAGTLWLGKLEHDNRTAGPAITDTNFHHVALTKSGSNVVLYIDGVGYPTPAYYSEFLFSSQIAIGANGDDLRCSFLGTIDEVGVYNRALAGDEVRAIYTAGAAGKCVVAIPPAISKQPVSQSVMAGANATFSVTAAGTPPLSYQWRLNGSPISGANEASLALANVQTAQAGNYSVVVSNSTGMPAVSSDALLTVTTGPATVRVVNTTATSAGGDVSVPITIQANGSENALGFSLIFDPNKLTYKDTALGAGATGAALLVNSNLVANGRLGLALALPAGATFLGGSQEVVRVIYGTPVTMQSSSSLISFSDQPTKKQLSDTQARVLEASFLSGTVTVPASRYEGDVAPRPSGDGSITVTDWVQAGRFAARLDQVAAGAEFQRADCAPRTTSGDGVITVSDWVQAGRYAAGLDAPTFLGGPDGEQAGTNGLGGRIRGALGKTGAGVRTLAIEGAQIREGQTGTLSVELEAEGNENALGFSLSFDPTTLVYAGAGLAGTPTGTILLANEAEVVSGRVGFVLALPSARTFAPGTQELLKVSFLAASSNSVSSPVVLTDQPVPREVSDINAAALATSYSSATIAVNPPPSMSILRTETAITLAWPQWATNYVLQSAEGVATPTGAWTDVSTPVVNSNNELRATVPLTDANRFYRLYRR